MFARGIGLASDDVINQSNTWQRRKLVLNNVRAPYKSMLEEKSAHWAKALYFFVERSERFDNSFTA